MSLYDITAYIMPSTLFALVLQILQFIFLMLAPVFDSNVTLEQVMLGTNQNLLFADGYLFTTLRSTLLSTVGMILLAGLIFFVERKRIKGVSLIKKILVSLLWPVFLMLQFPMDVQSFFSRHLGWKPIPHKDTTKFEHVNQIQPDCPDCPDCQAV